MITILITSRNWSIGNRKSPSGLSPLDVDAVGEGRQEGAGVFQLHLGDHGDGNNGNGKDGDKEDVVEITFVFCLTSSSSFSPSLSRSISKVSAPLINSSFFAWTANIFAKSILFAWSNMIQQWSILIFVYLFFKGILIVMTDPPVPSCLLQSSFKICQCFMVAWAVSELHRDLHFSVHQLVPVVAKDVNQIKSKW